MLFFESIWTRLVTFVYAIANAFVGLFGPEVEGPPTSFVIRRDGAVEDDYFKEQENFPSIDITSSLELWMADIGYIPQPLERFGVNEKTKKLSRKVFVEPAEATVAGMVYMEHVDKEEDFKKLKNELLNRKTFFSKKKTS